MEASDKVLFDRRVRLTVGNVVIEKLHVSFSVRKSTAKEPNVAEIRVYNLAETTRGRLKEKGLGLQLEAGYASELGVLFKGDVRTVDHTKEKADWVTLIRCGDGERAYRYAKSFESFRPGSNLKDVASRLADSMGTGRGNMLEKLSQALRGGIQQFANGFTANGSAQKALDSILTTAGYEWSIQDGAIQVRLPGASAGGTVPLLNSDTGLVGSPEHGSPDKAGKVSTVKARSLLRNVYICGQAVQLDARNIKGPHLITALEHTGDTHGGEWYTNLELRPL